jgi:hypothetical protein
MPNRFALEMLRLSRIEAGGPVHLPEGHQWCSVCLRLYPLAFPSIEVSPDKVTREQHLSGICSQKCWDTLFPKDQEDE